VYTFKGRSQLGFLGIFRQISTVESAYQQPLLDHKPLFTMLLGFEQYY